MEHWAIGHGTAFVFGVVLVYMFWASTKLIKTTVEVELIFRTALAGFTVILLLSLASMASGILGGVSGAIAVLAGGLFGLQMATMPAFSVVRRQETSKRPPEAEEAVRKEKK